MLAQMDFENASCFFRALIYVVPEVQFQQVANAFTQQTREGIMRPMSMIDAMACRLVFNGVYGLSIIDMRGRLIHHVQPVGTHRGLCLVFLDDKHQFAPHWLPYTSTRDLVTIQFCHDDFEALAPSGMARPETAFDAPYLHAQWLATLPPPDEAPYAQAIAPFPPEYLLGARFNVQGYICVNDPPIVSTGLLGVRRDATILSTTIWTDQDARLDVSGFDVVIGRPGPGDRAWAHIQLADEHRCGLMWELHPSVLLGADIHEDDFVFCQSDLPAHPRLPDVNIKGQYIPYRMSSIITDCGTWGLCDCCVQEVNGKEYCIYALQKLTTSVFGLFWGSLPLTTETVERVLLKPLDDDMPANDCFPTTHAALRAAYDLLARHISPELVGSLMMARNEELSLEEPSGRTPLSVARALEQLKRAIQQRHLSVPGMAPGLPFELYISE
jgi:hypothetical protein